jgi:DNA-binding transcriptional LysR family regulator
MLALVGTLASSSLTARLSQLRQAHPSLDLRLRTALSSEVSALVLRGDAALGLRYGSDPDPGLVSTVIHHERLIPVCPPGHPLAASGTDTAAALAGQRWVAFPPPPGGPTDSYTVALQQLLAAHGLSAAEILPIDSLTAQKRMAEAGFGLAILPESSLEEELRTGTLCAIDVPALTPSIPVALIRRRNAFQTGAARALTAALTDWPHLPGTQAHQQPASSSTPAQARQAKDSPAHSHAPQLPAGDRRPRSHLDRGENALPRAGPLS